MRKKLTAGFFNRPTLVVARELLGKYLVRRINGKEVARMIVETEAYDGEKDLACHARSGKTARNAPMWGPSGTAYVYFTYGMHWMLNLVTGPEGYPAAVLIRSLNSANIAQWVALRQVAPSLTTRRTALVPPSLTGPGKLTKFLQIDKRLNGKTLGRETGLWVEDRGVIVPRSRIQRTPRIGVAYAGSYATKRWRFVLKY